MAHILILEDDVDFRTVVASALVQNGHTVSQAGNGRTGLAMIQRGSIDLVITDVMMPEHDGLEVTMKLRQLPNAPPVIAMTGHPAEGEIYLRVAKSLGAQRVLAKPFTMENLLNAIREVLPA